MVWEGEGGCDLGHIPAWIPSSAACRALLAEDPPRCIVGARPWMLLVRMMLLIYLDATKTYLLRADDPPGGSGSGGARDREERERQGEKESDRADDGPPETRRDRRPIWGSAAARPSAGACMQRDISRKERKVGWGGRGGDIQQAAKRCLPAPPLPQGKGLGIGAGVAVCV